MAGITRLEKSLKTGAFSSLIQTPSQTIGLIPTPPKGGITLPIGVKRIGVKNGSVEQVINIQGKRFNFAWGYPVKMILLIN